MVTLCKEGMKLAFAKSTKKYVISILGLLLLGGGIYYGTTGNLIGGGKKEGFDKTISGMLDMMNFVASGKTKEGEKAFNEVHGFFHKIDSPLRDKDPELAEKLWTTVTLIEGQFENYQPGSKQLIKYAGETISLLKEAQDKLE
jgi:hypothetical protein